MEDRYEDLEKEVNMLHHVLKNEQLERNELKAQLQDMHRQLKRLIGMIEERKPPRSEPLDQSNKFCESCSAKKISNAFMSKKKDLSIEEIEEEVTIFILRSHIKGIRGNPS